MNSDDVIAGIIEGCGFVLMASELNDEEVYGKLASYITGIVKVGTKVISVVGGAGSGKSTLARKVAKALQDATTISTDDFVLGSRDFRNKYLDVEGHDPVRKYDFDLLRRKVERIKSLEKGESECVPVYDEATGVAINIKYDPKTGRILSQDNNSCTRRIGRVEFLIVEGDFQVLETPDRILFFHVPDNVRLQNRVRRDMSERGASKSEVVVASFLIRQQLQHLPYTLSYAKNANLIITVSTQAEKESYRYKYSLWQYPNQHF